MRSRSAFAASCLTFAVTLSVLSWTASAQDQPHHDPQPAPAATGQPAPRPMAGHEMPMKPQMDMMGDMAGPDDPVVAALEAINRRMHREMAVTPSGNPDRDFTVAMIAHHEGAVDMAKLIIGFGSDPDIRQLAQGIIAAQEQEIAFMQDWLAKHPQP